MSADLTFNGDPTVIGWVTFGLYLAASLLSFRAGRQTRRADSAISITWICIGAALLFFGINKQMDLQTTLIHLGRNVAKQEGVYGNRLLIHRLFFAALLLFAVALQFRNRWVIRRFTAQFKTASVGVALVVGYITIRAASIDHVDAMAGVDLDRPKWDWILEAGGLVLVILNASRSLPKQTQDLKGDQS